MRAGELVAALAQAREQLVDERRAAARNFGPRRRHEAAHLEVVLDGHAREQPPVLRDVGDAELDDPVRRRGHQVDALHARSAPEVGRIRPEMTRISVVLPAPLGPMTPTASPWRTSSDTSKSAWKVAVAGADRLRARAWARSLLSERPPVRRGGRRGGRTRGVGAEIDLDHARIAGDVGREALGDLLAVIEHHDPVDHPHQHAHDVLDPDDRDAAAPRRSGAACRRPDPSRARRGR